MKCMSALSATAATTAWAISPGSPAKLDYLQDFGVTAIWVLPFNPSPWRDDGYDISDCTGVHPAYGTLRDFKTFLKEAGEDVKPVDKLTIKRKDLEGKEGEIVVLSASV